MKKPVLVIMAAGMGMHNSIPADMLPKANKSIAL